MTETRDKLIIESETRGAQKTTSDVQGISKALDGVTVASEKVERSTVSVEGKFASLERRLGTAAAQARQFEKDQKTINDAVAQNPAFADRAADATAALAARHVTAARATDALAKSTGLARHELINLSRQAQDVVVSLQGGQGFGTVMLQQGSQILDVLGTSQGGIRGGLSGLATSLRGVATVGRVAFGSIAAAAAAAAYATHSYLDEQKDAQRALIGSRTASPGGINQIADSRSSLTGLSVSETREAALEFAKTGQIHSRVIGEMIETTRNFALVTGQSSKEAAAALAGAFTNIQGIDKLNQQFNFLDGNTRRVVESMLLAGRTTDAAALANSRLGLTLKEVENTQGALAKGWTAIGNAISDATGKLGEFIAKKSGLQQASLSEQADALRSQIGGLEKQGLGNRFFEATLQNYREKLAALDHVLEQINESAAFRSLSASASQAVAATDPLRGKLDEIVGKLTQLKDAQAAGINIPGLQTAVTYYEQIAQQLQNQAAAQDALAAKYPGMTAEFAKQVDALKDQNALLKARQDGTEATVSAAIAYKNAIANGANETEAAAIKAETLKNNLLQAGQAASNIQVNLDWSEFDAQAAKEMSRDKGGFTREFTPKGGGSGGTFSTNLMNSLQASNWISALAARSSMGGNGREAIPNVIQGMEAWQSAQAQFLSGGSKEDKIAGLEIQMQSLQSSLASHPENIWQIKSLQRSIDELKNSTDELNKTNTVALNPIYTQGKSALQFGYMPAARGVDFVAQGPSTGDLVPVHLRVNGGERVTVTPAGQTANDNRTSVTNIVINSTQSTSRRAVRQFAQRYSQKVAALS